MFQALRNIWNFAELRSKILFTLGMLAFYRIAAHVPVPFVDTTALKGYFNQLSGGGAFGFVDMFTGGAFSDMTIMALGVMPYISASIIIQVLTWVIPQLEKMSREGESGRRKINQITRMGATVLAAFQSFGIGLWMLRQNFVISFVGTDHRFLFLLGTMIALTAGSTLLMWMGERITDKGIGNGISIIIAAGIMSRYLSDVLIGIQTVKLGSLNPIWFPVILVMLIVSTVAIILVQEGARKVPIQHAKRLVGRRMQAGQTNYLPLKVNTAGVIPVILASALLSLPTTLLSWMGGPEHGTGILEWFSSYSTYNMYNMFGIEKGSFYQVLKIVNLHTILYAILTVGFCYFYTAIVFNPSEVAENLKKVGAYIPGYRPGKQTADYLDSVISRITLVGGCFLVGIALIPQVLMVCFGLPYGLADLTGGTGLIIVVGVVLETMRQIDSQLLMRHYEGFKMRRSGSSGAAGGRWSTR